VLYGHSKKSGVLYGNHIYTVRPIRSDEMKTRPNIAILALICFALCGTPAFALHSGFTDAKGDTVFSREFIRDYKSAQKAVDKSHSAEPLLKLLKKYKQVEEVAELELSIGVIYSQRGGVIDPAKAVVYFSNVLKYNFPEKTYVQILMWRGNSLEQLKKHNEALKDYLRGLLACSYHDLSGGWPEIKSPKVKIYFSRGSDDPEDVDRARDYRMYRRKIDFQRSLLRHRYFFIEATKRVQSYLSLSNDQVLNTLKEISPDTSRYTLIVNLLRSENYRPWR